MIGDKFKSAKRDYLYLLERGFPRKGIIKLIGDRYALNRTERSMLYRGITSPDSLISRMDKRARVREVKGKSLLVDGYNVMITIGNYLNGNTVFLSNDGYLRDAAEMHGKVFRKVLMEKVLDLLLDDLRYLKVKNSVIYFDQPVSKSGELASRVSMLMKIKGIKGKAKTADSPDHVLKQARDGLIATSDSSIIDSSRVKVFDLARHVIHRNFKPKFLDLR
ncbi:MAG: DUF434 domain-containing protein [Bacteroidales bacterium]|jgi:hypothetical protein|nr:DUF434 domain-containing protein [Bacteroidales bacterium]